MFHFAFLFSKLWLYIRYSIRYLTVVFLEYSYLTKLETFTIRTSPISARYGHEPGSPFLPPPDKTCAYVMRTSQKHSLAWPHYRKRSLLCRTGSQTVIKYFIDPNPKSQRLEPEPNRYFFGSTPWLFLRAPDCYKCIYTYRHSSKVAGLTWLLKSSANRRICPTRTIKKRRLPGLICKVAGAQQALYCCAKGLFRRWQYLNAHKEIILLKTKLLSKTFFYSTSYSSKAIVS